MNLLDDGPWLASFVGHVKQFKARILFEIVMNAAQELRHLLGQIAGRSTSQCRRLRQAIYGRPHKLGDDLAIVKKPFALLPQPSRALAATAQPWKRRSGIAKPVDPD